MRTSTPMSRITTVLVTLVGLAGVWFGVNYLLDPYGAASGFGISPWPTGGAAGYYMVKAGRDIASGAVILFLLARGQRGALAWVMLIDAIIPLGDMTAVLTHDGPAATAFGVHGATAASMALVAALLFREGRATASDRAPRGRVEPLRTAVR